jgi:pseudouridine synthase
MSEMRLQRWLAMCGVASRRHCEELILAGRVQVNERVAAELGTKVDPERDDVRVDGERVRAPTRPWYVALNKPTGVVCTNDDPAGRMRAIDLVSRINARLFPIGRLDEDSEGLLLLTNDGDFAAKVAHPRYQVAKIYRVTVKGEPNPDAIQKLKHGVWLAEGKTSPARVTVLRKTREFTTLLISLREGKNREIRRMLARVELPVTKLLRVQVGPVKLGTLKRGEWRVLERFEIDALKALEPVAPGADGPAPSNGPESRPASPGRSSGRFSDRHPRHRAPPGRSHPRAASHPRRNRSGG